MKYINLFALLFVSLNLISQTLGYCEKCYAEGEKCLTPVTVGGVITNYQEEGQCEYGLVCNAPYPDAEKELYICTEYGQEGDRCGNGISCDLGLNCNEVCTSGSFAQIGEDCSNDIDCDNTYATCIDGMCSVYNGTCERNNDCKGGQFCKDERCYEQYAEGHSCDGSDECYGHLECANDICKAESFKQLGQTCDKSSQCDQNQGLYCKNKICEKYVVPTAEQNANCTTTGESSQGTCDEYHRCSCATNTCYQSEIFPTQYAEYLQPIVDCITTYNCSTSVNFESSDSCVSKNCGSEYCNYLRAVNTEDNGLTCGNTYWVDEYCSRNSSSKLSISVLFTILISLVLVLL